MEARGDAERPERRVLELPGLAGTPSRAGLGQASEFECPDASRGGDVAELERTNGEEIRRSAAGGTARHRIAPGRREGCRSGRRKRICGAVGPSGDRTAIARTSVGLVQGLR